MFKVKKQSTSRLDIEISGEITPDEMRSGLAQLIEDAADLKDANMLYRIHNFKMPTMAALGVELGQIPKLFGIIGKFDRCALLCDAGWIRKAAEIEGALMPGVTIKSFEYDQEEAAEAWLAAT